MKPLLAILLLSLYPAVARAGLSEHDLKGASLAPPPNAAVPLDLPFRDSGGRTLVLRDVLNGRPALLLFVDYTCHTVCKPSLAILAGALGQTDLVAGRDYRVIVAGIDSKDGPDDARQMLQQIGDPAIAKATVALMDSNGHVGQLAEAVGYHAIYDPQNDQFAHPLGVLALDGSGRVARVMSSIAANSQDLRLALVDAGKGRIGTIADRLTLLCYCFDPVHGIYASRIEWLLDGFAGITVIALAGLIGVMLRRERARGKAAS